MKALQKLTGTDRRTDGKDHILSKADRMLISFHEFQTFHLHAWLKESTARQFSKWFILVLIFFIVKFIRNNMTNVQCTFDKAKETLSNMTSRTHAAPTFLIISSKKIWYLVIFFIIQRHENEFWGKSKNLDRIFMKSASFSTYHINN